MNYYHRMGWYQSFWWTLSHLLKWEQMPQLGWKSIIFLTWSPIFPALFMPRAKKSNQLRSFLFILSTGTVCEWSPKHHSVSEWLTTRDIKFWWNIEIGTFLMLQVIYWMMFLIFHLCYEGKRLAFFDK